MAGQGHLTADHPHTLLPNTTVELAAHHHESCFPLDPTSPAATPPLPHSCVGLLVMQARNRQPHT